RYNMKLDWQEMTNNLKYQHVRHLVLLPFYKEGMDVVEHTIKTLLSCRYDHQQIFLVLGAEARAGSEALAIAKAIEEKYAHQFGAILTTVHPADVPGDMPGKGSNISYMAEQARVQVLDPKQVQ